MLEVIGVGSIWMIFLLALLLPLEVTFFRIDADEGMSFSGKVLLALLVSVMNFVLTWGLGYLMLYLLPA